MREEAKAGPLSRPCGPGDRDAEDRHHRGATSSEAAIVAALGVLVQWRLAGEWAAHIGLILTAIVLVGAHVPHLLLLALLLKIHLPNEVLTTISLIAATGGDAAVGPFQ